MDRGDLEAALEAERERVCVHAKTLYPGNDPGAAPGSTAAWQALAESLLTKEGGWRKRSPEAKGYFDAGETHEPLRHVLGMICSLPPPQYTDAQAEVSVRLAHEGRSMTSKASDPDTLVASAKAYLGALNKIVMKRQRDMPASAAS